MNTYHKNQKMNYRKKHKHITTKIKSTLSQKSKLHFDNKEIFTIFPLKRIWYLFVQID